MVRIFCILLWLGIAGATQAQVKCFARVSIDKNQVYPQEPFRVTITVLTATWFTSGLEFDNLQIPNAFILPFSRTIPQVEKINGQTYAGLQFYYIVFPYTEGRYAIPRLHIRAETPALGESVSRKTSVYTNALPFTVRPLPEGAHEKSWLVAKGLRINETWSKSLKDLKVGDVIERQISIYAQGTLPQFIPELPVVQPGFATVYDKGAELKDLRDDYDANGLRRQTFTYLLEKEGHFQFPEIQMNWWNPYSEKLYTKKLATTEIQIAANPHLGMLKTIRDSLALQGKTQAAPAKKGPWRIYGIPWYWAGLYALVVGVLIYFIFRFFLRFLRWCHDRYQQHLQSESRWFRRFHRARKPEQILIRLYQWWDRARPAGQSASLAYVLQQEQLPELAEVLLELEQETLLQTELSHFNKYYFRKAMRYFRKQVLKKHAFKTPAQPSEQQRAWKP